MIRKILLTFSFSFYTFGPYSQTDTGKMIYFKTLPRLEVIYEQIYQKLDSAIIYNRDCIYAARGKPYYFEIKLYDVENDTIFIDVGSFQYSTSFHSRWVGYFQYKDNLVLVKSWDDFTRFFQETSDTLDLYYKYYHPYMIIDDNPRFEYMSLIYYYENNTFIPKCKYLCMPTSPYYYSVDSVEGILDTWESIASDYDITVKELKSLNKKKRKRSLKSGEVIRVY